MIRADDDLEFKLRRSIALQKEKNRMAKKKTVNRAAIGRERRLALALVALLDQGGNHDSADGTAEADAGALLDELGYSGLVGIPKQIAAFTAELKTATEAGEWAKVATLGQQLERVKLGKSPTKSGAAASAAKKSSTKKPPKVSEASTKTDSEGATDAATASAASVG